MPMSEARRQETRRKIELGGLVLLSGLVGADLSTAELVGALVQQSNRLGQEPALRDLWKSLGDARLTEREHERRGK